MKRVMERPRSPYEDATIQWRVRTIGWFMLGIAMLFFLFGSVSAALTLRFLHGAARVTAVVTTSHYVTGGRANFWLTSFAVTAPDGRQQSFQWQSSGPFREGSTVEVLYRPDRPGQLRPAIDDEIWRWPRFFAALGAILLLVSGCAFGLAALLPPSPF